MSDFSPGSLIFFEEFVVRRGLIFGFAGSCRAAAKGFARRMICPKFQFVEMIRGKSRGANFCASAMWLALLLFVFAGCSLLAPPPPPSTQEAVLLWLKNPAEAGERATIARSAKALERIPGIEQVEMRREIPGLPPTAPHDFDLGLVITFRSHAALVRFQRRPRYRAALSRYLRPRVRRYEVYQLVPTR